MQLKFILSYMVSPQLWVVGGKIVTLVTFPCTRIFLRKNFFQDGALCGENLGKLETIFPRIKMFRFSISTFLWQLLVTASCIVALVQKGE